MWLKALFGSGLTVKIFFLAFAINVYFSAFLHKYELSMRIKFIGFLLVAFSINSFSLVAQPKDPYAKLKKDVKAAFIAYDNYEYAESIELLKAALGSVKGREDKSEVLFRIAQCYRFTNNYSEAATFYMKAAKLEYKDPLAQLYYADMKRSIGEYEEALVGYQDYKKLAPTDPKGDIGIESCTLAKKWIKEPSRYQVDPMVDLNSEAMDFSPAFAGKRGDNEVIIFTSNREESEGKEDNAWTGGGFADIYISEAERKTDARRRSAPADGKRLKSPADVKWSTPRLLDESDVLNTMYDEGSATYESRRKEIYFGRCLFGKNEELECGLYITEQQGEGWKDPERIIIGKDTLANIGQPSLSPDDKMLYFVSTAYKGKGGRDIFVTTFNKRDKVWNEPTNLGDAVNTERDEYFPFAHNDGYLYFSSNGWPGMGGLDVFRIRVGDDGLPVKGAKAENMQFPINTGADDFGLIFQPGNDQVGFMSSNRTGAKSDDIYAVVKTPMVFNIEGVITSSKDGKPLDQVTVTLTGGAEEIIVNTDARGKYVFNADQVDENVTYEISYSRKKFLSNSSDVTTVGVPLSAFEFTPAENRFLHVMTVSKKLDPIDVPIVLPNVLFETAKWDLNEESRNSLDTVVAILVKNPTIVIEMRSHTDYKDTEKRNQILSQHRADTCVEYLISKGIDSLRLVAGGKGESEPFVIPTDYKGFGAEHFEAGKELTERYIRGLSAEISDVANQINRRTDMKVLRDDYVPKVKPTEEEEEEEEEKLPKGEIYVLGDRESLGVAAKKNKISVVDLKRINGGMRGVRPVAGLQLKITKNADYSEWDATHYQVMKRNMSLKAVAKELGIDNKTLEELNPDVNPKAIPVGYWIAFE